MHSEHALGVVIQVVLYLFLFLISACAGIATHYSSWRMLQWGFLIYGLTLLISLALWLPETSHPGSLGFEKTLNDQNQYQNPEEPQCTLSRRKWRWVWLNPFSSLGLLRSPNLMLVVRRLCLCLFPQMLSTAQATQMN